MQYFKEKNGIYKAKFGKRNSAASIFPGIAMVLLPLIVGSIIYYQSSQPKSGSTENIPMMFGLGILIVINLIGFLVRKAGAGAGIAVDLVDRTLKFRRAGLHRQVLNIDSIQEIKLKVSPGKISVFTLLTRDEQEHLLTISKNVTMIRELANELSALISVTVSCEDLIQ